MKLVARVTVTELTKQLIPWKLVAFGWQQARDLDDLSAGSLCFHVTYC